MKRKITNVLVTGGAGFIGSNFIRTLLKKKNEFSGRIINLIRYFVLMLIPINRNHIDKKSAGGQNQ